MPELRAPRAPGSGSHYPNGTGRRPVERGQPASVVSELPHGKDAARTPQAAAPSYEGCLGQGLAGALAFVISAIIAAALIGFAAAVHYLAAAGG